MLWLRAGDILLCWVFPPLPSNGNDNGMIAQHLLHQPSLLRTRQHLLLKSKEKKGKQRWHPGTYSQKSQGYLFQLQVSQCPPAAAIEQANSPSVNCGIVVMQDPLTFSLRISLLSLLNLKQLPLPSLCELSPSQLLAGRLWPPTLCMPGTLTGMLRLSSPLSDSPSDGQLPLG